jgi:hypothetical protein
VKLKIRTIGTFVEWRITHSPLPCRPRVAGGRNPKIVSPPSSSPLPLPRRRQGARPGKAWLSLVLAGTSRPLAYEGGTRASLLGPGRGPIVGGLGGDARDRHNGGATDDEVVVRGKGRGRCGAGGYLCRLVEETARRWWQVDVLVGGWQARRRGVDVGRPLVGRGVDVRASGWLVRGGWAPARWWWWLLRACCLATRRPAVLVAWWDNFGGCIGCGSSCFVVPPMSSLISLYFLVGHVSVVAPVFYFV